LSKIKVMKLKFLITNFLIFNVSLLFAQAQVFSGRIIESALREPIEGVLLILNNKIIASTNDKGVFRFSLYNPDLGNEISITHVSYQSESMRLKDFINELTIELKEDITQLDEVVIDVEKKITNRQILKRTTNYYRKHLREDPYWAEVNLKQVMNYEDSLQSYIEIDGNIYTLAGDRKMKAHRTIIVPLKVRRTKEDWNSSIVHKSRKEELHWNYWQTSSIFHNYTFLESYHPLSKKRKKYYNYTIEKSVVLDDEICYLINYKEKTPFKDYTNTDRIVRGQLWIRKNDFSLRKISAFINHERTIQSYYAFTIDYTTDDDILFPKHISYNTFLNHSQLNYQIEGELDIIKIDKKQRANYGAIVYEAYFFSNYIWDALNAYDEAYWFNKPVHHNLKIEDKSTLNNLFKEGILQRMESKKELKTNTGLYKVNFELKIDPKLELIKIMKRDLKIED